MPIWVTPVAAPAASGLVRTIPKLVKAGQIQPPPKASRVKATCGPGARRAKAAMDAAPMSPVSPATRNGGRRMVSDQ